MALFSGSTYLATSTFHLGVIELLVLYLEKGVCGFDWESSISLFRLHCLYEVSLN